MVFARSGAVATKIALSILHVARRCGNSAARTLHGPRPRRTGHSTPSFACVPARILFLSGGAPLSSNVVSPCTLSIVYIMAFGMGISSLQSIEGPLRSFFGTGPVEPLASPSPSLPLPPWRLRPAPSQRVVGAACRSSSLMLIADGVGIDARRGRYPLVGTRTSRLEPCFFNLISASTVPR